MTTADGVRAALSRLASVALRATGADRCAILVRDGNGRVRLRPAAAASRGGPSAELWNRFLGMEPIDVDSHPELGVLWRTEKSITLDDAASSAIPESWKREWASKSVAVSIIRAGGEPYGLLVVDYVDRHHSFTPEEAGLLDAIAGGAGVALRTARLLERLQRSVEVERRLAECAAAVQTGRSLPEVLDLVAHRYTLLLPDVSCSICLLSADQTSFRPVAWRGPMAPPPEVRIDDLPQEYVEAVRARWTANPQTAIVISDRKILSGWGTLIPPDIDVGMLLPLSDGQAIIGFSAIGRAGGPFTDAEVAVARKFADQASIAAAQARLRDALQARLRLTESLHRLSENVVRTSNVKTLLRALNRDVCADLGVVCLHVAFTDHALATLLKARVPNAAEAKLIKAWRAKRARIASDRPCKLAAPVPIGGRIAGILWFRVSEPLDATAVELLEAVATALGEVAYKAKLHRTAERRAQELAIASERERIARDLHDTVGQSFYGIGLKLQDILIDVEDPELRKRLEAVRLLAARAVSDVRSAVYALSFMHVRARGLVPSLKALANQFERTTGILTEFRVEGDVSRLPEEVESALYRAAHEALVNVERHARASGVVVVLAGREDRVDLTIRDDGVGLDQRQAPDWRSAAHFGMRMMARAIEEAGGRFNAHAAQPRGLLIRAVVPRRRARARGKRP